MKKHCKCGELLVIPRQGAARPTRDWTPRPTSLARRAGSVSGSRLGPRDLPPECPQNRGQPWAGRIPDSRPPDATWATWAFCGACRPHTRPLGHLAGPTPAPSIIIITYPINRILPLQPTGGSGYCASIPNTGIPRIRVSAHTRCAMQTTNNIEQAAAERMSATAPPKFQIIFGSREVCELTGLLPPTLKQWTAKGWVRPIARSRGGRGRQNQFTAWQTIGLAILAAALRSSIEARTIMGRVGVVRAMQVLEGLDDSLLLPESNQSPHIAEEVAAEIARAASPDLPCECLEGVACVVAAIDRKVGALRERNRLM
jgi:hypothetical protein